jgi:hypothetical protein
MALLDALLDELVPAAPFRLLGPRLADAIRLERRASDASGAVLLDEAVDAVLPLEPAAVQCAEKLAARVRGVLAQDAKLNWAQLLVGATALYKPAVVQSAA